MASTVAQISGSPRRRRDAARRAAREVAALAARHRAQPALDQIGLVGRHLEPGANPAQGDDLGDFLGGHRPASANLAEMMSPSNGFMMYSLAPASSASRMWARSFSTLPNPTVGASPSGSARRRRRN